MKYEWGNMDENKILATLACSKTYFIKKNVTEHFIREESNLHKIKEEKESSFQITPYLQMRHYFKCTQIDYSIDGNSGNNLDVHKR